MGTTKIQMVHLTHKELIFLLTSEMRGARVWSLGADTRETKGMEETKYALLPQRLQHTCSLGSS